MIHLSRSRHGLRCRGAAAGLMLLWLLAAMAAVPRPGAAATRPATAMPAWERIGPPLGVIGVFAVQWSNPDIIYAAGGTSALRSQSGLYKTTDGGDTWQRLSGFPDLLVMALWLDQENPRHVLAAGSALYVSQDGGETWQRDQESGLGGIRDLAESGGALYAAASNGVFESLDRGATWRQVFDISTNSLGAAGEALYALSYNGKLYRRLSRSDKFEQAQELKDATAIAVDPADPLAVYVGTFESYESGGIFVSRNGGRSFVQLAPVSQGVQAIALEGSTVYVGTDITFQGFDTTTGQQALLTLVGDIRSIRFDPGRRGVVYTGTDQGLFKSEDGGKEWLRLTAGLKVALTTSMTARGQTILTGLQDYPDLAVSFDGGRSWNSPADSPVGENAQVVFHPLDPAMVYTFNAFLGSRFLVSADGGRSFRKSEGLPANLFFLPSRQALAFDYGQRENLYLATSDGIYGSTDWGATWKRLSWPMAAAEGVAVDPTDSRRIYVTTETELYITADGGATFTHQPLPSQDWLFGDVIPEILPDAPPVLLLAGDLVGRIYRSTDGGHSFTAAKISETLNPLVTAIHADPLPGSRAIAVATLNDGAFLSVDGGLSWRQVTGPEFPEQIEDVWWDGDYLYAATWGQGLIRTTRAALGLSPAPAPAAGGSGPAAPMPLAVAWTPVGPRSETTSGQVGEFAVQWSDPDVIYVAGGGPSDAMEWSNGLGAYVHDSGIYKSTDGGKSWQKLTGPEDQRVTALWLDQKEPRHLLTGTYTSIFGSQDGGLTWSRLWTPPHGWFSGRTAIKWLRNAGGILYAGTEGYTYQSTDGGATWSVARQVPPAVSDRVAGGPVASPIQPNLLYKGDNKGLLRSRDGGATWQLLTAGLPNHMVETVAAAGERLLTYDYASWSVQASFDGGQTWSTPPGARDSDNYRTYDRFAVHPLDGSLVYGLSSNVPSLIYSSDGGRTFRQASGTTTAQIPSPGFLSRQALAVDRSHPGTLYMAAPDGVYRSTDWGAAWEKLSWPIQSAEAIAVNPSDGKQIFIATDKALYITADGGATFTRELYQPSVQRPVMLAFIPGDPPVLLLIGNRVPWQVLRSTDGGRTFQRVLTAADRPSKAYLNSVTAVAVDPTPDSRAVALSTMNGVYLSRDAGLSWQHLTGAGVPQMMNDLYWDGDFLYVATRSYGILRVTRASLGLGPAVPSAPAFFDLERHGWARAAIDDMAARGIIKGTGPGTFDPDGRVTRAQLAALLQRLFSLPQPAGPPAYADVGADHWAFGAVQAVGRYLPDAGEGRFEPSLPADRQSVAFALAGILTVRGRLELPGAAEAERVLAGVRDGASVSPPLRAAVAAVIRSGIMKGDTESRFDPAGSLTRAQAAVLLQRLQP